MKNETDVVTAANSKTMNALETSRLFAAAADNDTTINFNGEEKGVLNKISSRSKTNFKKRVKQK